MKRSEINACIRRAEKIAAENKFLLPPFAYWAPGDWADKGDEYNEIRDTMLGWDVTDHGLGRFSEMGLVLFTIRNGSRQGDTYAKPYAEKLMIVEENQHCPNHFHWSKMEDIINRGGGNLLMRLYNSTPEGGLADTDVVVSVDDRRLVIPAGGVVRLTPGESVTLPTGMYHTFWGEEGYGPVMAGEVSQCNDDKTDNRYLESHGQRFPGIEEDEPPYRLLCNEYPAN